jgi:hypothetical protein
MLTYVRTWMARRRSFVGAWEQPSTMAVRQLNRATSRVAAGWLAALSHMQAISRRAGRAEPATRRRKAAQAARHARTRRAGPGTAVGDARQRRW